MLKDSYLILFSKTSPEEKLKTFMDTRIHEDTPRGRAIVYAVKQFLGEETERPKELDSEDLEILIDPTINKLTRLFKIMQKYEEYFRWYYGSNGWYIWLEVKDKYIHSLQIKDNNTYFG